MLTLFLSSTSFCVLLTPPVAAATRFYHNLDHLMSMFDFLRFATRAGVVLQDPAAIDWAVWFHDIIYDPRRYAEP